MAAGWLVGGFVAMVTTWPPAGDTATDRTGPLLLMFGGSAMATISWIGVSVLSALDDLRADRG